jgi:ornithine cyclodeaminase/alanine dehydrogenase-like protein (mu-crystallin family)
MVRILGEADVARAISMAEGVRIVEAAIRQYTEGQATLLPRLSLDLPGNGGAFRVMAASMPAIGAFGLKTLTGYPGKRLPGETYFAILLFSAEDGALRSVMAAGHLTGIRTGAVTGVAAKYLAREDAKILGVFGAGVQARQQIAGLMAVRPITLVKIFDVDRAKAEALAACTREQFGIAACAAANAQEAVVGSDLVVTATTARQPVFRGEWIEAGTHVSGVGANTPAKRELDATTFQRSKIVVDFKDQALEESGDLREALKNGSIALDRVQGELGDIVTGKKEGRTSDAEITLFKSVGIAIEDIATAAYVLEQAELKGLGTPMMFDGDSASLRNGRDA